MRHLPRPTDGPYEVRSGDSACSGQDAGLNSLREREKFLISPYGPDCLQLKTVLRPKCHILGVPEAL